MWIAVAVNTFYLFFGELEILLKKYVTLKLLK